MNPRWSLLLLPPLLLACVSSASSPSPASQPPAAPAPSASVAASPDAPPSGWTAFDPRAVRCGVDDRPSNILGLALPAVPDRRLADRVSPDPRGAAARRAPGPSPVPFGTRAPLQRPPPVEAEAPEPEPPSPLFISRLPPTLAGAPLSPPELASAFTTTDPQYEICLHLADASQPDAQLDFDLELASTGAPMRVLPRQSGQPTPFTRCLMERTCQYQARASLGRTTTVQVPVRVSHAPPSTPVNPPGTPAVSAVRVDAMTEAAQGTELELQLRSALSDAARSCGGVAGRARVRFITSVSMSALLGVTPRPARGQRASVQIAVGQIRTQSLEGELSTAQIGCVVGHVMGRAFVGDAPSRTSLQTVLTWNP